MNDNITIYVLSDSIGETGELIARAAVKQFKAENYEIKKFPYVSEKDIVKEILLDAKEESAVVIYTTVSEENRDYIEKLGIEYNVQTVDVMSPPLDAIEKTVGYPPKREAGLIRRLDENYFKKVEAVEFTVKYDDGKDPRGIMQADICLLGVSRTSKTPLSMYLAHKKYKVANIPLLPEVPAPKELFEKDKRRVFGLIADSKELIEIRRERLKALGLDYSASYAKVERINEEIEYSKRIMDKLGCVVIDVSSRAIEETATIIMEHMSKNFGDDML